MYDFIKKNSPHKKTKCIIFNKYYGEQYDRSKNILHKKPHRLPKRL